MLQNRRHYNYHEMYLSLLMVLGIALSVSILLIFLISSTPLLTLKVFFTGPFSNRYFFGNMINRAIPLIFAGLGISLAFQSRNFNLGGEGQIYFGALLSTLVYLAFPEGPVFLTGLAAASTGMCGGMVLAGLSAFLKKWASVDELISTFLISSIMVKITDYLIAGPFKDPESELLATKKIAERFHLPLLLSPSQLNISLFYALAAVAIVFVLLYFSLPGFELRMKGLNSQFSYYGGLAKSRYLLMPLALSGLLHGLAGSLAISGTYHNCIQGFSSGMGWNGIAVALIARNNALTVIPAALFFAWLDAGAESAMLFSDMTFEFADIVKGVIFFFITAQQLISFCRRGKRNKPCF